MAWIRVKQDDKAVWVNSERVSYVTEAERADLPGAIIFFEKDLSIVVDETIERIADSLRQVSAIDR